MGVAKENVSESGCGQRERQTIQLNDSADRWRKREQHPFAFAIRDKHFFVNRRRQSSPII